MEAKGSISMKSLERVVSDKALKLGNSFPCQICVVGFLLGICLTSLFLAALTSLGTFELAAFSFSSVFPPCNSTSQIINADMDAHIDMKLKLKKTDEENDDQVKLLLSAWDNLLQNNEDYFKNLGMNKSDVPNAPHLENCEERTRVRERLDKRIKNQTFPSWINGGDEENYPLTRRVQRDIWYHQHPLDCENKSLKFLVADWETLPGFGIGAQIAGMTGLLAIAINENRVLVANYYNRADHDGCKGSSRGSWSCYFLPETSKECRKRAFDVMKKREAWESGIITGKQNYSTKEIWSGHIPKLWGKPWSYMKPTTEINGTLISSHRKMDRRWWRAQAVRYLIRFQTEYTCGLMNAARHSAFGQEAAKIVLSTGDWRNTKKIMSEMEDEVWSNHKPWIPRPMLSLHVRMGDKACEMRVAALEEYMRLADRIRDRFPELNRIWLSTEMKEVVDRSKDYGQWRFYYTEVARQVGNKSMAEYEASLGREMSTNYPKFPGASVIKDYRPIACCNTLYKLISRLLVAKLKPLVTKLILCFADDLLIFSDGSQTSIQGILNVLDEFRLLSGLAISPEKSCFYGCGLSDPELLSITQSTGIPHGSLPIRYLGLPLCTKKLTMINCEPLLQKIKSKINSWTAKYLSFAGRQVLINTVIAGITNFWSSAFILPKECIKQIDSMCAAYLWKGSLDGRYSAKVAWITVTLPKQQGGLGIRNLEAWNQTCALKLLWMLIFKTESIWVAWIHQNVIKDSSIWVIKEKQSHTWIFKQLLRLRDTILRWIRLIPGNGRKLRFWIEPWTPYGSLMSFIGSNGPRLMGINIDATVSDVWRNGGWSLPPARSPTQEELHCYLTNISLTENEDRAVWLMNGKESSTFSAKWIYDNIRPSAPEVNWAPLIWLKRGIPKHKSMAWLFLLNRCPTRDRLRDWGLQSDDLCLLCNLHTESRNHLFFLCDYSYSVWGNLLHKMNIISAHRDWDYNLDLLLSLSGITHLKFLAKLAWQASIYEIWKERNHRLHRNTHRSPSAIQKDVENIIKNRISSFRQLNPSLSSDCMQLWLSFN